MPRLLAVPDKFRSSAGAAQIADAMARAAEANGWAVSTRPMSDGGEGFLEAFGGANRSLDVTGANGAAVGAAWRFEEKSAEAPGGPLAIIEMAEAAGLARAGGPTHNDPIEATTAGVGELIAAAVAEGARTVLVGCGGSATTDGGAGAVSALERFGRSILSHVSLVAACDVQATFVEAARLFGPQKGATGAQVRLLEERLRHQADDYRRRFGVDVRSLPGSGAAGGLAGGLAVLGAELRLGFDVVKDLSGLADELTRSDAVATGEGRLDDQSFNGKVVGGVATLAGPRPVLAVVGRFTPGGLAAASAAGLDVISLTERFGPEAAMTMPLQLVEGVTAAWLQRLERDGRLSPQA